MVELRFPTARVPWSLWRFVCRLFFFSALVSCSLLVCGYVAYWCRVEVANPTETRFVGYVVFGRWFHSYAFGDSLKLSRSWCVWWCFRCVDCVVRLSLHNWQVLPCFMDLVDSWSPWVPHASAAASWLRRFREEVVRAHVPWKI